MVSMVGDVGRPLVLIALALPSIISVLIRGGCTPSEVSFKSKNGELHCLFVKRLRNATEKSLAAMTRVWAETRCVGKGKGKKGRLPKVDTRQNMHKLLMFLKMIRSWQNIDGDEFIWLGLQRDDGDSNWYWTRDNTIYDIQSNESENFWDVDRPDNNSSQEHGEMCAVARVTRHAIRSNRMTMLFQDRVCNASDMTTNTTWPMYHVICERPVLVQYATSESAAPAAKNPDQSPISTTDGGGVPFYVQWWFYVVCVVLVTVPSCVVVAVCAISRGLKSAADPDHTQKKQWSKKMTSGNSKQRPRVHAAGKPDPGSVSSTGTDSERSRIRHAHDEHAKVLPKKTSQGKKRRVVQPLSAGKTATIAVLPPARRPVRPVANSIDLGTEQTGLYSNMKPPTNLNRPVSFGATAKKNTKKPDGHKQSGSGYHRYSNVGPPPSKPNIQKHPLPGTMKNKKPDGPEQGSYHRYSNVGSPPSKPNMQRHPLPGTTKNKKKPDDLEKKEPITRHGATTDDRDNDGNERTTVPARTTTAAEKARAATALKKRR